MKKPFVPDNADIPNNLNTKKFMIRKLTIHDLIKDYEAVMSSVDHLIGTFGSNDTWPEALTLEEDLIDLGWHQKEFELKSSFAYTIMSLNESKCLGCVYINPTNKKSFDAEVIMWVRQSELNYGLDQIVFTAVKEWLNTNWGFSRVAFPGREIPWEDWENYPVD